MSLDELLDLESLISLLSAVLFLGGAAALLHPKIRGNSIKRYLIILATLSGLFFLASAWPLLVEEATPDQDFVYWSIAARTLFRAGLPPGFLLLVYKAVRHHE